ncbi:MAG: ABC transporter substrate-binding protein [Burkholderiales bacterium]|nr:ABC transporter substrate-binding protein [Burkholderiales bacterium]
MKKVFFAFLLCCCAISVSAEPKVLKIATGELAPYATEAREDKGIALSIVRRAFELAGYQVEYTFLPWSRTLAESKLGKWDGTAYWGKKPEHAAHFLISDNVVTEQWLFVYRNDVKFHWDSLQDLKPYRVGLIQDYTYTPEIWQAAKAGEFKSEKLLDEKTLLKMMLLQRIDIAPLEKNVACDTLLRHFSPQEASRLSAFPKLMTDRFTTHLMLPKSKNESAQRMQEFNAGLQKLRASGEYAKLLAQVNCPTGWGESK